jgi:signal transduction histidine kinase
MRMKISFKPDKQFFRYYLPLFLLFSVSIFIFQWNREKKYKSDLFDERLSDFNEIVYQFFENSGGNLNQIDSMFRMWNKDSLRITIIDLKGVVVYDNVMKDKVTTMENHISRPEIVEASMKRMGSDIRVSATTKQQYYYRATRYGNCYVRTSYPFNLNFNTLLSPDNLFLYFWLIITFAGVTALLYFTNRVRMQLKQEQMEHDATIRRQLTQQVAHELKTPLTSIVGYMETLQNNPELPDDKKSFFIQRSHSQAIRLNELLQDLLLLNQLNEAPRSIVMEPVSINKTVNTVIDDVRLNLENNQVSVELSFPEEIWIKANPMLIYSIFRNLIDNSLAYAGENVAIGISMIGQDSKTYTFKYWDTGKGVDEQHLMRLFDRFYRVDKGRSRKNGGTGLGLAIVKNAIELHQGSVSVQNREAGGLEFIFSLHK